MVEFGSGCLPSKKSVRFTVRATAVYWDLEWLSTEASCSVEVLETLQSTERQSDANKNVELPTLEAESPLNEKHGEAHSRLEQIEILQCTE